MMKTVHVAVAVILDASSAKVLISRRAMDAHQGGLWEFPGGKVEEGESIQQALARELQEELDITPTQQRFFMEIAHDYTDKRVKLDTWIVDSFSGKPRGKEYQPICWVDIKGLADYQFPQANQPILDALMALSQQAPAN